MFVFKPVLLTFMQRLRVCMLPCAEFCSPRYVVHNLKPKATAMMVIGNIQRELKHPSEISFSPRLH